MLVSFLLLLLHEKVLILCFLILLVVFVVFVVVVVVVVVVVLVKIVPGYLGSPLLVNGGQSRCIVCDDGLGRHRER